MALAVPSLPGVVPFRAARWDASREVLAGCSLLFSAEYQGGQSLFQGCYHLSGTVGGLHSNGLVFSGWQSFQKSVHCHPLCDHGGSVFVWLKPSLGDAQEVVHMCPRVGSGLVVSLRKLCHLLAG